MNRSRGFTLLEVVLAMTALALVSTFCYGALWFGTRAVEKGASAVVTAQRLRVATDVFIRQIKSVMPYEVRDSDENVYPFFFGGRDWMSFVTAAGQLGGGGLARVTYRFADDPPRLLIEESSPASADTLGRQAPDAVGDRHAILLDGFRTMSFEYLLDDGADVEWRREWDGAAEEILPLAVRILVEGLPGLGTDLWGQEIPLMAVVENEDGGEAAGEEDFCLGERPGELDGTESGVPTPRDDDDLGGGE